MNEPIKIWIFTVDLVFAEILKRILETQIHNYQVSVLNAFSDAQNILPDSAVNLVLVDDHIEGISSYELISFIRLNKKMICPIIYFGTSEHDSEKRAILIGANHFINKPFNSQEVARIIHNKFQ